ncbi:MAG: alpha-E domain-containing protein [Candidatus Scalindua sp. AMX11]|nr:MAG: alpha-E domain-containing protein [Candidatus Scalindua sp.]NOG85899.1 alpha-E domain-containing protein [Planctomycetota bacterium]RZV96930.1 MAG: alpha-E domain-containing protein [Candidatus Scalindua sp. SCAELEC01]TDE66457.1 MAG: alpha-E domain-containing protein [Candidatus Scalindua sp. AMX11]
MLSRVASSIYWINRYIERAENYARFIDVNHRVTMDLPPGLEEQWRPLVETTGGLQQFEEKYGEKYSRKNVIKFLVFDVDNPNSIISCLSLARENARTVREIISSEMWLQINKLYLNVKHGITKANWSEDNLTEMLISVKMGGHTFEGVMDATCSHGEGWHFGITGRNLERADKTTRILDMKYYYLLPKVQDVNTPLDMIQWSALLRSAGAYEMYRKQYGKLEIKKIITFLALDTNFPRSMHYCLIAAERSLHAITGTSIFSFSTAAEKELGKLRSEMDYTDIEDIMNQGLHEYLDAFQMKHNRVSEVIFETFFSIRE